MEVDSESTGEPPSVQKVVRRALLTELRANQADVREAEQLLARKLSILGLVASSLTGQAFHSMCPGRRICETEMIRLVEDDADPAAAAAAPASLRLGSLLASPDSAPATVECVSLRQFVFFDHWMVCAAVKFRWRQLPEFGPTAATVAWLQTQSTTAAWQSVETPAAADDADGRPVTLVAWCQRPVLTSPEQGAAAVVCQASVQLAAAAAGANCWQLPAYAFHVGALRLDAEALLGCDWLAVLLSNCRAKDAGCQAADGANDMTSSAVAQLTACLDRVQLSRRLQSTRARHRLLGESPSPSGRRRLVDVVRLGDADWFIAPSRLAGCRLVWPRGGGDNSSSSWTVSLRYCQPEQPVCLCQLLELQGSDASAGIVGQPTTTIDRLAEGLAAASEAASVALDASVDVGLLPIGVEPVLGLLLESLKPPTVAARAGAAVADWIGGVAEALGTATASAARGPGDDRERTRLVAELGRAASLLAKSVTS